MRFSKAALLTSALGALLLASNACSSDNGAKVGTCKVEEGDYIGPTTGFWYDEKHYCATEVDCDSHCTKVAGQDNIRGCKWDSFKSCTGSLPAKAKEAEYCAIALTIDCGGEPSTDVNCISCDVAKANESDYDGTCLTQYGSSIGRGTTCEEAKANVK